MSQYFSPIGSGLGDVIVSLPILHALIATGEPTILVARSPRQENLDDLIPGLAGTVRLPDFASLALKKNDRVFDFRSHPIQTQNIWGTAEFESRYPGIRINDILKIVCDDYGIEVDFSKPRPIVLTRQKEHIQPVPACRQVALIPGTVTDTKSCPLRNWQALVDSLKHRPVDVIVIGEPDRSTIVAALVKSGIAWKQTPRVSDALHIIDDSMAVVSVDTGLMHLAVSQGKPTIALFENNQIYYRPDDCCLPLFASPCQMECVEALERFRHTTAPTAATVAAQKDSWVWHSGDFNGCLVTEEKRCMSSISVSSVLCRLEEIEATCGASRFSREQF